MTKKKSTKRALISSLLILAMCFTMLAGTTFAWFTDTVESGNNIIKSGKLSIDLLIDNGNGYVSVKESATPVVAFPETILWEPGYTAWANAKVVTDGNLALKYTMKIAATGEVSKLAEVIDVYYKADEVAKPATRPADLTASGLVKIGTLKDAINGTIVINDTLIPGSNAEDKATIALHMQETAGNEYQNLSIGSGFKFVILATQYTYEEDAFDDQYDAAAEFPGYTTVEDAAGLAAALADPEITNITLDAPVSVDTLPNMSNTNKTIDLNGKTLTQTSANAVTISGGNVEYKNGTIAAPAFTYGNNSFLCPEAGAVLTLEDVEITTTGTAIYPKGNTTAVNVIDSTITAGCYAIGTNANAVDHYGVEINVEHSTLSTTGWQGNDGDAATVLMNVAGTLNIKDSTITGHRQAVVVRAGTANISNTAITYDGACSAVASRDTAAWSEGNEVYGAAIVVGNKSDAPATAYLADAVLTLDTVTVNNTSERATLAVFGNPTYKGSVKLVNTDIPAAKQVIGDNASVA